MESIKLTPNPNPTPKQVAKQLQGIARATQIDKQLGIELEAKRMRLSIEEYKLYSNFTELIDKWQKENNEESQKKEEQISEKVEIENNTPIKMPRSFLSDILRKMCKSKSNTDEKKEINVLDDFRDIDRIRIKKIGDEENLIQIDVFASTKHIFKKRTEFIMFNLNSQGQFVPQRFFKSKY